MSKKKKRQQDFLNKILNKTILEDNIFPDATSDREFVSTIVDYFLGEDYYVINPVTQGQANTYMLCEIIERYYGAKPSKD